MFGIHPEKKETYVGCYEDKLISGHYCPEFNTDRVQPKHSASCNVKICNYSYKASEGYKFPKCFEIYGGMSCQNIRELNSCTTLSTSLMIFLSCLVISFIFVIFLFFYICCIGYCIRKRYQNDSGYLRYLGEVGRALKNCILQIVCGPGPNNDNEDAVG